MVRWLPLLFDDDDDDGDFSDSKLLSAMMTPCTYYSFHLARVLGKNLTFNNARVQEFTANFSFVFIDI